MDTLNLRQRILLNQPHIESANGDIINFTTNMKAPLKKCKVYFNPIQEGEGDPSPDNVRPISGWTGVDIYNDPKYGGSIIWNQLYDGTGSTGTNGGITYTKLDNGTWEIKGTSDTTSGTAARRRQIKTPSWEANHVYWFSARAIGEGTQYLQMVLSNSGSIKAVTTLYDGAFVKPTAKINQFSFRVYTQNVTVDAIARPQIVDLTKCFGETMANYIYNLEKSKSGTGIDYFLNLFPKDWYEYNAGEVTTVSAVNGDPYTSTPMSWSDDIGTIYGGYVDLAKGELVATHALFDAYQNRSLFKQGDGNVYILNNQFATYGFIKPININKSISTHFKAADVTTESYPSFSISDYGYFAVRGIPNVTDTVEHFTAYVEEQMNNNTPVQFVMPLITPVIYQLTPQQLLTFKGINNIWSNTNGQTEVKFWTH